jgi:hypothetical protein
MKKLLLLAFSSLSILLATSFTRDMVKTPNNQHIVLVLKDVYNQDRFSVFSIREVNNVLVGTNIEEYPVANGIYRIEGSSNDKFYHKHILIQTYQ